MPVVGFITNGSADASARFVAAFRNGLNETGYVEGRNVTVEYHWLEGQYDRLPGVRKPAQKQKSERRCCWTDWECQPHLF